MSSAEHCKTESQSVTAVVAKSQTIVRATKTRRYQSKDEWQLVEDNQGLYTIEFT